MSSKVFSISDFVSNLDEEVLSSTFQNIFLTYRTVALFNYFFPLIITFELSQSRKNALPLKLKISHLPSFEYSLTLGSERLQPLRSVKIKTNTRKILGFMQKSPLSLRKETKV